MVNVAPLVPNPVAVKSSPGVRFAAILWKGFWLLCVVCWPVIKWVLSLDVAYHFARMVFLWDTPGSYAGWVFLLHFAALTAATFFVANYRPKG